MSDLCNPTLFALLALLSTALAGSFSTRSFELTWSYPPNDRTRLLFTIGGR
jgi:hypothetical protein